MGRSGGRDGLHCQRDIMFFIMFELNAQLEWGGISYCTQIPLYSQRLHYDTTSRSIRMAVKASFGFSTDDSRPRYVQIWWDRCFGSWVYGSSLITRDNSPQYR